MFRLPSLSSQHLRLNTGGVVACVCNLGVSLVVLVTRWLRWSIGPIGRSDCRGRSDGRSIGRTAGRPLGGPIRKCNGPDGLSVRRPAGGLDGRSVGRSAGTSPMVSQLVGRSVGRPGGQSVRQSIGELVGRSVGRTDWISGGRRVVASQTDPAATDKRTPEAAKPLTVLVEEVCDTA